jgi:hypothetical protein
VCQCGTVTSESSGWGRRRSDYRNLCRRKEKYEIVRRINTRLNKELP